MGLSISPSYATACPLTLGCLWIIGVELSWLMKEELRGCQGNPCSSTRQHCHPPKTAKRSSVPNRVLRMLHAPAFPPAETKARGPSIQNKLRRTLHAPALPPVETAREAFPNRIRRTLHAPAPLRERFDAHDPWGGSSGDVEISHGATARAF